MEFKRFKILGTYSACAALVCSSVVAMNTQDALARLRQQQNLMNQVTSRTSNDANQRSVEIHEIAELRDQVAQQERANQTLRDQVAQQERANQTLRDQVAQQERANQTLRDQVAQNERENQTLRDQVAQNERENQTLRDQVARLEGEKRTLRDQVAQNWDIVFEETEALEKEIKATASQIKRLEKRYRMLSEDGVGVSNEQLEEYDELKGKKGRLEKNLEEKRKKLNEKSVIFPKLQDKIKQRDNEIQNLQDKIKQGDNEIQNLQDKIKQGDNEIQNLQDDKVQQLMDLRLIFKSFIGKGNKGTKKWLIECIDKSGVTNKNDFIDMVEYASSEK